MGRPWYQVASFLATAAAQFSASQGGLVLEKRCGEDKLECPKYFYCSQNEFCSPCQKICEKSDSNFTPTLCEQQCQDYMHDVIEHYIRSSNSHSDQNIEEMLKNVYLLVALTLIVSVIVLGTVTGALVLLYIKHRRQQLRHSELEEKAYQKKLATVQYVSTINNNRNISSENTPTTQSVAHNQVAPISTITPVRGDSSNLHLEMPSNSRSYSSVPASTKSGTPPSAITTTTSITTKYPSEDRTLEYVYDNLALTPSPVLSKETSTKNKTESRL